MGWEDVEETMTWGSGDEATGVTETGESASSELASCQEELSLLRCEVAELREKVEALTAENSRLTAENAELRGDLDTSKKTAEKAVSQLSGVYVDPEAVSWEDLGEAEQAKIRASTRGLVENLKKFNPSSKKVALLFDGFPVLHFPFVKSLGLKEFKVDIGDQVHGRLNMFAIHSLTVWMEKKTQAVQMVCREQKFTPTVFPNFLGGLFLLLTPGELKAVREMSSVVDFVTSPSRKWALPFLMNDREPESSPLEKDAVRQDIGTIAGKCSKETLCEILASRSLPHIAALAHNYEAVSESKGTFLDRCRVVLGESDRTTTTAEAVVGQATNGAKGKAHLSAAIIKACLTGLMGCPALVALVFRINWRPQELRELVDVYSDRYGKDLRDEIHRRMDKAKFFFDAVFFNQL